MIPESSPGPCPETVGEGERLVKLALYVKEHPGASFAEIRRALPFEYGEHSGSDGTARRRFERDKDSLREYGVFLAADSAGRYSIDRERSYAAPVDLTESQESLLRLLCNALLEDESYPFKSELRMVLAKIGDEIDAPDLLPSMEGARSGQDRPAAGLKKVRKAISARKLLHFEYRNARGVPSTREVEPFGCFLFRKNCYVVAFDPAAGGERVFRLDRMGKLRVNAKSPHVPDFDPRPFKASDYYGLPFQFGDDAFEARVSFDADNAWRAERLCMGQGRFEESGAGDPAAGEAAGTLIWVVEARDLGALASWCVENGPGIVPTAPPAAREAYVRGIEAALAGTEAEA